MAVQIPQRVLDGIWERIDVRGPDDCWPWKLSIGSHGYGQVGWGAKGERRGATTAMRAAWTATHGPIPGELTVDHICRNRVCCNPAHLRLLTNVENAADTAWAHRTHCVRGHAFDAANTAFDANGHRVCITCRRARRARRVRTSAPRVLPPIDRACCECGGIMPQSMRRHAIYCGRVCANRAGHRAATERARASR